MVIVMVIEIPRLAKILFLGVPATSVKDHILYFREYFVINKRSRLLPKNHDQLILLVTNCICSL